MYRNHHKKKSDLHAINQSPSDKGDLEIETEIDSSYSKEETLHAL